MDKLTYRQLQKLAKEYGIPANLKKDNMIVLLTAAKEEREAEASQEVEEVVEEVKEVVAEVEEEQTVPPALNETVEQVEVEEQSTLEVNATTQKLVDVENEAQMSPEKHSEEDSSVVQDHEEVVSPDIQQQDTARVELQEELIVEDEDSNSQENNATIASAYKSYATVLHELESGQLTPCETSQSEENEDNSNDVVDTVECEETKEVDEHLSPKQVLLNNLSKLSFRDLQKVAKSLGIAANYKRATMTDLIVEEQLAHQAQVVVEVSYDNDTPAKTDLIESIENNFEDVSAMEIDSIFDKVEIEQDNYEDVDDYNMVEDYSHQKKLFSTPMKNTRIIFSSPSPTKSGSKPYEKYNVKWTYEDYESNAQNGSKTTPIGVWYSDEIEDDPSTRIGKKMRGMATPQGEKITFASPLKSAEKPYYQYNVHWSYEQY